MDGRLYVKNGGKIEHYEFNFTALIAHDAYADTLKKAVLADGGWIEYDC